MRLPEGFKVNNAETFGVMKFSALHRERMRMNVDGSVSDELKERVYDLKCQIQGCMISVGIPAEVPLKEFEYDSEVELVNPVVGTVATATYGNNADVDWWVKADDIVLKGQKPLPEMRPRPEDGNKKEEKK